VLCIDKFLCPILFLTDSSSLLPLCAVRVAFRRVRFSTPLRTPEFTRVAHGTIGAFPCPPFVRFSQSRRSPMPLWLQPCWFVTCLKEIVNVC
jgi:hypothetical protein